MLTPSLQKLLAKKGIHIERKIPKDIFEERQNHIVKLYKNAGFENVPREVVLFMGYFDNIEIEHKGYKIAFHLEETLTFFTHHSLINTEKLLEKTIIPLGVMQSGWYDVFADEHSAVYAFHIEADEMILYGSTPFEALENILKNNPLEQIQIK